MSSKGWMLKHQDFVLLGAPHGQPLLWDESHLPNDPIVFQGHNLVKHRLNQKASQAKWEVLHEPLQRMRINDHKININSLLLYFCNCSFKSWLRHFLHWLAKYCSISLNVITFLSLQFAAHPQIPRLTSIYTAFHLQFWTSVVISWLAETYHLIASGLWIPFI